MFVTVTVLVFKKIYVSFSCGFYVHKHTYYKFKTFSNDYRYLNLETFIIDVNLVFENCEKFNEDDSEIGRAGHSMRRFFDKRWTELLQ